MNRFPFFGGSHGARTHDPLFSVARMGLEPMTLTLKV